MAVVHQNSRCTGVEGASDCSVGFIRHQTAKPVIISGVARLDRVGLIFVHHPRDPFHVDRDVDPHDVTIGTVRIAYRGSRMDARTWGLVIALAAFACAPRPDRPDTELL